MTQRSTPLSSLQRAVLNLAPREWTIIETNVERNFRASMTTLITRGIIERKKVGSAEVWRVRPVTLREAVQRMLDAMPAPSRSNEPTYQWAVEEVRRIIEQTPDDTVAAGGKPLYTGEYTEEDVAEARKAMGGVFG